ncbi:unnamed protein product [Rotaria sp. Silwood1]|nr:unnamed protein product [Rotaria sp. Silwood1]CAF3859344.1 unnamed protein product [Rotaria sp. Silwood1]
MICNITLGTALQWNLTGVPVAGDGNIGKNANNLNQPQWLHIDANGSLYICDYSNHRIQLWLPGATNGTTVAGDSACNSGSSSNQLNHPQGIEFDNNGYMYVVDAGNNRVQRYSPNSNNGTTVAGIAGGGGSATNKLNQPSGVAVDAAFNIFITDSGNHRVVKWALNATNGIVLIDGSAGGVASGQLGNPCGILLINGSPNQVYLSDQSKDHIQIWTFGADTANTTWSTANGANLNQPAQIALDPYGNLYVADMKGKRVVVICANSTTGTVILGTGTSSTPTLKQVGGIAFDSNLNLYVSEMTLNQVYKYTRL